ncbi:MAG: nucleotidyltransferase family protein [Oscillospiraceae bacterium]|nr:nucleotidyltransferase family protein [Oscillospiraceae bacterium]
MKVVGLICEFNPLHLGHAKLLQTLRREFDAVVCVMSGNFVQRGECAAFGKFVRAQAAVRCGADLVLELPVSRVLQSAEGFASGGVEVLRRLGCVDALAFGCESGDAKRIYDAAAAMDAPGYEDRLRDALSSGMSYAAAKQQAMAENGDLLRAPNDILAVEYCRAVRRQNAGFQLIAVQRGGDYHAQTPDAANPSAEAIRACISRGEDWLPYIPEAAKALFSGAPRYAMAYGERAVLARLRAMDDTDWEACAHGSEGLYRKVQKAVLTESSVEDILQAAKSKRYPMTRLNRLLMCAYLGITAEDITRDVTDCRILACSEQGRPIIRAAKNGGDLTLRNPGEAMDEDALDRRCGDLFALFAQPGNALKAGAERDARIFFSKP